MKPGILLLSLIAALLAMVIPLEAAEISLYEIAFDIAPSGEVKEGIHVAFTEPVNESYFTYLFAGDVSGLRINNSLQELDYEIEKTGSEYKVRFQVPQGTKEIYIFFSSGNLVFQNSGIFQFFTNFHPPPDVAQSEITVVLPQGFSVYRDMVYPKNPEKTTDGSRIYLSWIFPSPEEEIPISVKFYSSYQSMEWLIIPIVLAFSSAIFLLYFWSRRKSRSSFLKGFTEDERKVIEVLSRKRHAYQNRLEKELGFSKAKMTRITQKLESKGLIEREKAGRTKRIEWKG